MKGEEKRREDRIVEEREMRGDSDREREDRSREERRGKHSCYRAGEGISKSSEDR